MEEGEIEEAQDPRASKLMEANISLIVNNYNDIFSSFDPRSYSERALSVDFLEECKRAAREKGNAIELRILVPKKQRDLKEEWKIKKRLHEHFSHHKELIIQAVKGRKKGGVGWILLGFVLLALAVFSKSIQESLITDSFVEPILTIPGWFAIWEGLERLFKESRELTLEVEFYTKMTQAEINFSEY